MKPAVLVAAALLVASVLVFVRPIAQDGAYHDLADQRSLFGIPNALNVGSNLPFLVCGLYGIFLGKKRVPGWARWPYLTLFSATVLVAAGSTYYHLRPDNGRLVWDRLPMAVGFAALLAAVVADRVSLRGARLLFVPLILLSGGGVIYWSATEAAGAGDLRPYALTQFGSMLLVVLILLLYPEPRRTRPYLVAGLSVYALAKVFERADRPIYALGQIVSGHTLKHLAAAAAVTCIAAMLAAKSR